MLLVARVRRTLLDRGLLSPGSRVIVGVSGGPDSTALLDVLCRLAPELALTLRAVGVDHGLREAAAAELDLAERHASACAVAFERIRVNVSTQSGVPSAAREARYAALRAIGAREEARIAVGHTQDDQAETVVARVLRGSGLRGLAGIDPARTDGVVRPLVDATRAEVRAYLAHNGLAFAEDPSNADPRYERTRVRSSILPALVAEDAQAAQHLAWLADEAREADALLEAMAATLLADAAHDGTLALSVLRAAPRPVALRALRSALGPEIGRQHLSALLGWLHDPAEGASLALPKGRTAQIVRDRVVLAPLGRTDPDEEA